MIFVVGPGRCGTSTVARLLHDLGVSMGTKFRRPDQANPEGYWEDLEFKDLNEALLQSRMSISEWEHKVRNVVREESWGLKDPRFSYLLPYYREIYPTANVVRCVRPLYQVARSMHRVYRWPIASALIEAERRESLLDRFAPDAYHVNFSRWREDGELKCQLSNLLK